VTAVEELRRAAAQMRAQQGEFWDALADWLEITADWLEMAGSAYTNGGWPRRLRSSALTLARAYLDGEQP
jgi:hypothetical protein